MKTSYSAFREIKCPPTANFSFSTAVILKIRSRSPSSYQFFVMSHYVNLVRLQPVVYKILCRQESVTPMPMPTGSALKTICPTPHTLSRAPENRKNSRSGPKLRILDRFQTPQNTNKSVQQVCALNPIFPQPTNFHESKISKKSQIVKSSQTDNVRAGSKQSFDMYIGETDDKLQPTADQINYVIIQTLSKNQHFTDLCGVNKRLTRIISNGSLIINPFV